MKSESVGPGRTVSPPRMAAQVAPNLRPEAWVWIDDRPRRGLRAWSQKLLRSRRSAGRGEAP
jgi:hypothetical protein